MEKYGWIFIIFLAVIIYIGGYNSGSENGYNSGYNDGYADAESELSDQKYILEDAQNCINLHNEQLEDINSRLNDISSDLEFSLNGDYYDLYNAVDRAYSDINLMMIFNPCN